MKKYQLFLILLTCCFSPGWTGQPVSIAVVPLDYDQPEMVEFVVSAINSCYNAQVSILPIQKLPPEAFYRPRQRYRADKLLDYLETNTDGQYQKVLGITGRDISTTKGEIYDWGIFGLGSLGGRACVVSTFRLKGKVKHKEVLLRNANPLYHKAGLVYDQLYSQNINLLEQRIAKVVNHELGHTLGLDHCPKYGCLMEDAGGGVDVVDRESGSFCRECRNKLGDIVK